MTPGRTGLTLLELMIALAILGLVSGWLLQVRVDSLRHAREQRRHVALTQLLRSEAEVLRAGAAHAGSCAALTTELADQRITCTVVEVCAVPLGVCGAAPGLRAWRIEASGPSGSTAELALVTRAEHHRWIAGRR